MRDLNNINKLFLFFEDDFYNNLTNNKLYLNYKSNIESMEIKLQNKQKDLFNKYIEKQSELEAFEIQEALIFGFKSAVKLFYEILK